MAIDYQSVEGIQYELRNARGRLGKDPELTQARSGESMAKFSIAVDRNRRLPDGSFEKIGVTWHQVRVYGAQAENIAASLKAGDSVIVSGRGEVLVGLDEQPNQRPAIRTVNALNRGVMVTPDLTVQTVEVQPGMRAQARESLGVEQTPRTEQQAQQGYAPTSQPGYQEHAQRAQQSAATPPVQHGWPTAAPGSGGARFV